MVLLYHTRVVKHTTRGAFMIEVVIALCFALGAWFYSILRYYDLWKRGKVPVVFFAFLHIISIVVVFLYETGISAMISDVVSVIMHAYAVIYGSVMLLTPVLCFFRGIVRCIGKKAGCSGKIYRFFNHPTKLILGFFVVTLCAGAVIFWKSRCISWEETVILQENKKEPVKDTSIVYISNCFVGSDMTAHAFDSLVEKVNEKKPDVILLGGNLFGKHTKEETVDKTLASIKKMKAALGIYMVEGCADSALVEQKKEKFSSAGVHLLLDESAFLHNGLQIVGCRAADKEEKPMSYTLSLLDKEKPSIVLAGEAMEEKLKEEKKISLVLYPKKITDTGNGGTSGINQMFPRNVLASAKINFIQIKK